jgi:Na+-transporting NADH:ubiquinone oxidoreductase subunit C
MKEGNVALTVVKNGKVADATVEVDGVSGGTITSVGVADMLKNCLDDYTSFLTK